MDSYQVLYKERKGQVLRKAKFGCLTGTYALNVTMGCGFSCVYCYARGYTNAPPKGKVYLFTNLPYLLTKTLDGIHRRVRPDYVVLNTASDCFQDHPDILNITYQVMEVLLSRGIGISFLTKGYIPDRFMGLFKRYCHHIMAQVGLVSLSEKYWKTFEPGAARPQERLENISRLKDMGVIPQVRMDPIIPFITDTEKDIDEMFKRLRSLDVKSVSLSYLHLRPAIMDHLKRELPSIYKKLVESLFQGQKWTHVGTSTKTKLVPQGLRKKGYQRIKSMADRYGISTFICACKNPDLKGSICISGQIASHFRPKGALRDEQLSLFC